MPNKSETFNTSAELGKIVSVLVQNWFALAIVLVAAITAALAYALIRSASYEVGAQLIVQVGNEVVAPPSVSQLRSAQMMPVSIGVEEVNNEVRIMKDPAIMIDTVETLGHDFFFAERPPETLLQQIKALARDAVDSVRGLLETVLIRLGLREPLTPLEKVVVALQQSFQIESVPQSSIIELRLVLADRGAGEPIMRTFIDTYLARRREIYAQTQIETFFTDRLGQIAEELERREAEHAAAKRRLGTFSVDQQRTLLLEQNAEVQEALDAAVVEARRLREELAEIDSRLATLPEQVVLSQVEARNPIVDEARLRLLQLEVEHEEVVRRAGQEAEEARTLREQMDLVRARAAGEEGFRIEQRTTGTNALRERLVQEREDAGRRLVGVEAEIDALEGRAGDISERLAAVERSGLELVQQGREIERLSTERQQIVQALSEARVAQELSNARVSNVVLAAAPQASLTPVGPRLSFLFLVAAILSLGATGLLLVLMEMIWPKVRSEDDLKGALGGEVPVKRLGNVKGLPA